MGKKSAVVCAASTRRTDAESLEPIRLHGLGAGSAWLALLIAVVSGLRALWRATKLLSVLYLTYGCMHLAPVARLRRWGTTTWWVLVQESPEDLWQDNLPNDPPVTIARVPLARHGVSTGSAGPDRSPAEEPRAA